MLLDAFLELVPPPTPPPTPRCCEQPCAVDLPDELLRVIFDAAVDSDMRTSRKLLATAKWIRACIGREVFTTQYIRTHEDVAFLVRQPDTSLALVRNLWVNVRSQRLPALLARMPHVERLALSVRAARRYGNPCGSAFSAPLPLREFEFVSPGPSYVCDADVIYYRLRQPTFRLTHVRLGYINNGTAHWLAQFFYEDGPALLDLTHLALDACPEYPTWPSVCDALEASVRLPALRVIAVVVPAGVKDAQAHMDIFLGLRVPQLVVLLDPPGHPRTRDWKARSDGKRGFWERVAALGVAAPPS